MAEIKFIFAFEQDRIIPDGFHEGWQTGGMVRFTRIAFSLWNGYVEQGVEGMSAPYEIFDCVTTPRIFMKRYAYVILDISQDGYKEVLIIEIGENESAKYRLSILNGLKNRGVSSVRYEIR